MTKFHSAADSEVAAPRASDDPSVGVGVAGPSGVRRSGSRAELSAAVPSGPAQPAPLTRREARARERERAQTAGSTPGSAAIVSSGAPAAASIVSAGAPAPAAIGSSDAPAPAAIGSSGAPAPSASDASEPESVVLPTTVLAPLDAPALADDAPRGRRALRDAERAGSSGRPAASPRRAAAAGAVRRSATASGPESARLSTAAAHLPASGATAPARRDSAAASPAAASPATANPAAASPAAASPAAASPATPAPSHATRAQRSAPLQHDRPATRARTTARTLRTAASPAAPTAAARRPSAVQRTTRLGVLGAMLFVGATIVSTSVPANAYFVDTPEHVAVKLAAAVQSGTTVGGAVASTRGHKFVASDVASAEDVGRDGYSVTSKAQTTIKNTSSGTFTNDPTAAVQWPFTVGVPISSGFGARSVANCSFCSTFHEGLDFTPGAGSPIQIIADGTVSKVDQGTGALGYNVWIEHTIGGKKITSVYAHMIAGSIKVTLGEKVKVGQIVGLVGSTGNSTGAHLHFEIHIDGVPVDPYPWLEANAGA